MDASMKEIIEVPFLSDALRRLNTPTSLLIRSGSMLYTCGLPPLDPLTGIIVRGTIAEQTHAVLQVMKVVLESAGSCLDNVVKTTIFVTDPAMMDEVNAVYREYFPENPPVRSFVAVKPWPFPFDIEIDVVAHH
jgi:2-iminobutanoate/2-iminopropanoate deaminase